MAQARTASLFGHLLSLVLISVSANHPSAALADVRPLKILQFNAWQLKALGIDLTKDRKERLRILPDYLAATQADVMTLSEVWSDLTKRAIVRAMVRRGYPFSSFSLQKASMGDGLLVLSKFRITGVRRSRPFHPFTRMDEALTRKRAVRIALDVPGVGGVDLFQAHMGAVGFHRDRDRYDRVQKAKLMVQLEELADFIRATATSDVVILGADLNANYQEYGGGGRFLPEYARDYRALVEGACPDRGEMRNSFLVANGMSVRDKNVPTYSAENPYVSGGIFAGIPSETEDYLLYCPSPRVSALKSEIVFRDAIPESDRERYRLKRLPKRLSDHYGVVTEFGISSR